MPRRLLTFAENFSKQMSKWFAGLRKVLKSFEFKLQFAVRRALAGGHTLKRELKTHCNCRLKSELETRCKFLVKSDFVEVLE